jgi:hypothetical protein
MQALPIWWDYPFNPTVQWPYSSVDTENFSVEQPEPKLQGAKSIFFIKPELQNLFAHIFNLALNKAMDRYEYGAGATKCFPFTFFTDHLIELHQRT